MAEDTVTQAAELGRLSEQPCATRTLRIHGFHDAPDSLGDLGMYGSDAAPIRALMERRPDLACPLHAALTSTGAEVVWAATMEMARTVEDVLARRTRALFLNARAAIEMAPAVAALLASTLGRDARWQHEQVEAFGTLAAQYQ
jgi:glycerol-3-phosphate dehydrogenase